MKSIFIALAPNFQKDDAWLSLKLLFSPWRWRRGPELGQLAEVMSRKISVRNAVFFDSGRSALEAILRCSDIGAGDEVLLQAFTCVAVPNSVIWAGAKPVYVDCNEQYTMSVEDLKQKISPRCKAIIIQHTFGIRANMEALTSIAREHKLFIIEDCAHSLASYGGDASFFSFGRDKVISAVFGGAAATRDATLAEKLRHYHAALPLAGMTWIKRQLSYPSLMVFARATYDAGIGRLILGLLRGLRILSRPVLPIERRGGKPGFAGHQMPNALAVLALHQLVKLDAFTAHRKRIIKIYEDAGLRGFGILRFAFCTLHSEKLRAAARRARMFLGDWYTTAIAPAGVSYQAIGYEPSSCPTAERLSGEVINLPTHINISEHDAQRIATFISTN